MALLDKVPRNVETSARYIGPRGLAGIVFAIGLGYMQATLSEEEMGGLLIVAGAGAVGLATVVFVFKFLYEFAEAVSLSSKISWEKAEKETDRRRSGKTS